MAEGDKERNGTGAAHGGASSDAAGAARPRRGGVWGWATVTLGRQVTVMLVVALLVGAAFIGVFSLVLLGDAQPWVPVQAANAARDQASVAADRAAGTPRAERELAAYEIAELHAATVSAQAREAVRTGLLVVAGLGGVWGLVVAYRRQQHLEHHERPQAEQRAERERTQLMTERFRVAADQLGSPAVATRLAGVYSMAALADEWTEQQQQCIDVLCAYLRVPWYPEGTPAGGRGEEQVRLSVIAVMRDHLLPDAEQHWRERYFDFRRAVLPTFRWSHVHVHGEATFGGAVFGGPAWFDGASFGGAARFGAASFGGDAWFGGASFGGEAWFGGASFSRAAVFHGAVFSETALFDVATFGGDARFDRASFSGQARYGGALFRGETVFGEAVFGGDAVFRGASFSETAWFGAASFGGDAWFDGASFGGAAWFGGATFKGAEVSFRDAAIAGDLTAAQLGSHTALILPDGQATTEPGVIASPPEPNR